MSDGRNVERMSRPYGTGVAGVDAGEHLKRFARQLGNLEAAAVLGVGSESLRALYSAVGKPGRPCAYLTCLMRGRHVHQVCDSCGSFRHSNMSCDECLRAIRWVNTSLWQPPDIAGMLGIEPTP